MDGEILELRVQNTFFIPKTEPTTLMLENIFILTHIYKRIYNASKSNPIQYKKK
jgi:hypothetical protein